MFYNILAVFVGGGIGATIRYLLTYSSQSLFDKSIYATLIINLLGCLVMGCMFGITSSRIQDFNPVWKLFITVGFLGGLTTLSTFSLEGFQMLKDGQVIYGLLYIVGTTIFSVLLTYLGYLIGK